MRATHRIRWRAAILCLTWIAAACGPSAGPPSGAPTPTAPSGPPGSPSALAPSAGPVGSPGASGPVGIDPTLLEVLPANVDGLEVVENPDGEAAALGDPILAAVGSAIAAGLAIDPASGDFVYAIVVRLLSGAMDETVFRDFRATFDEGACSQADGVARTAETGIGGRTVYIGTCVGGLRTYHVWLEDRGVLVSASAVGERHLGEQLMLHLRP